MSGRAVCVVGVCLSLALAAVTRADTVGPTILTPDAQAHFEAARLAAGSDFTTGLVQCNGALPQAQRLTFAATRPAPAWEGSPEVPPKPTRVFDNLYYLGVWNVTSWAVRTPKGIILIDSLDNGKEVASAIEAGLHSFGLDPKQIRYVIVTHGHGDHYGGARYLAKKYHAHVLMSDADWELSKSPPDKPFFDPPPNRDLVIRDGQALRLGGETLTMYLTPGHTLGTVSVLIPVTDRGVPHVVALWGGAGFNFPHTQARFTQYADSAQRFLKVALAAGADVPLSNHPEQDRAKLKNQQLAQRGANDPNPYVMGQKGVRHFLTTFSECAQTFAAQLASGALTPETTTGP